MRDAAIGYATSSKAIWPRRAVVAEALEGLSLTHAYLLAILVLHGAGQRLQ